MQQARRLPRFFVLWSALPWVLGEGVLVVGILVASAELDSSRDPISMLVVASFYGLLISGVLVAAAVTGATQAWQLRRAGIPVAWTSWTLATFAGVIAGFIGAAFAEVPVGLLLTVLLLFVTPHDLAFALAEHSGLMLLGLFAVLGAIFICAGLGFGAVLGAVQSVVLRDAGIARASSWWWKMALVWTLPALALMGPQIALVFLLSPVLVVSLLVPGVVAGLLTGVALKRIVEAQPAAAPDLEAPATVDG